MASQCSSFLAPILTEWHETAFTPLSSGRPTQNHMASAFSAKKLLPAVISTSKDANISRVAGLIFRNALDFFENAEEIKRKFEIYFETVSATYHVDANTLNLLIDNRTLILRHLNLWNPDNQENLEVEKKHFVCQLSRATNAFLDQLANDWIKTTLDNVQSDGNYLIPPRIVSAAKNNPQIVLYERKMIGKESDIALRCLSMIEKMRKTPPEGIEILHFLGDDPPKIMLIGIEEHIQRIFSVLKQLKFTVDT